MRYKKAQTRYERMAENKQRVAAATTGTGLFIYRNRTNAQLFLIKPSNEGKKSVQPNETWTGDSYFEHHLKMGEASLVGPVETPTVVEKVAEVLPIEEVSVITENTQPEKPKKKKERMTYMEKLMLDQPDKITQKGKTEYVVPNPDQKLNEESPLDSTKSSDILINEDPVDGVIIVE